MECRLVAVLLCTLLVVSTVVVAEPADIDRARRDISSLRYQQAEKQLVDIARSSGGDDRQEALFLLAGLKNSVSEAQMIYQEVVEIAPETEWGQRSQVELAKIQYAVGDYGQAFRILEGSAACRRLEEACYFQGLSAVMLKRYDDARQSLSRVRRGSYRPWAFLALAEVDMETEDAAGACQRYRSMARSGLSPTAMYRYGECLEKTGDAEGATTVFEAIGRDFRNTPEAVLAGHKLEALAGATPRPVLEPAPEETPLRSGFTIQFGAFHDRTNAIKLMAQLKSALPGVRIDSELLHYKEVHRVRFGYFATRDEAQQKANDIAGLIHEPITIMTLP
jgi:TolA-binding protein